MSVLDLLLQKKLISKDDIREVRKATSGGSSLDDALITRGVKPEDIIAARGEFLNIPVRSLDGASVPFEALDYIPEESAAHYRFVPVGLKDGTLQILCGEPVARAEIEAATRALDIPFALFVAPEIWIAAVQQAIYGRPMEPRLVRLFARVVGAQPVRRWQAAHTPAPPPAPPEPPVEIPPPRMPRPVSETLPAQPAPVPAATLASQPVPLPAPAAAPAPPPALPSAPPPLAPPAPSPYDKRDIPSLIKRLAEGNDVDGAHARLVAITKQDFGPKPRRWAAWWKQHQDDERIDWLFEGLSHKTAEIREAAEQELRALTGEYFGYAFDLPRGAREAARARWQSWWAQQQRKPSG